METVASKNSKIVQEDVAASQGLSNEFDSLLEADINQQITCNDFFDYFVTLGDT